MLEGEHSAIPIEHSAILLTFIKLPFVNKIFVLTFFEWSFYTGFTVISKYVPWIGLGEGCMSLQACLKHASQDGWRSGFPQSVNNRSFGFLLVSNV